MSGNFTRRVERLERETGPAELIELQIESGVCRGGGDNGVVTLWIPAGRLTTRCEGSQ
jgi:hypothetical protein